MASDMALRGRIGGLVKASRYDRDGLTSAARNAFLERFEDEVDPERGLPEEERARRAKAALRAHMTRLALRSARAKGGKSMTRAKDGSPS